ncbi:MAG TPA: dihydroorotate dehydrogenase-like protein [Bdellovibrionota bacterium]|nr:dihydroorotate dehydrogenase-like protein [Bdellovibrionota bacterium]
MEAVADLTTNYLGLKLPHPLIPGASPMVDDLDLVKILEDSGAAAIVMHSLFEEQIVGETLGAQAHVDSYTDSFGEALSYLPTPAEYQLGPDDYLEQIREIKLSVGVPVIGSLNGTTEGGWLQYARLIEEAGADALELNVYSVPTDLSDDAAAVERRVESILRNVRKTVKIPIAVKLSPFFSSLPHFAKKLEEAGADGLVLFNRFYQPDIDPEELEVRQTLRLSDPSELTLRLTWLAVLSGRVKPSLAVSGGVHSGIDAVKATMAGAHAVQLVSVLLRKGPKYLAQIRHEMSDWLEKNEYDSLEKMRGNMNLLHCPDPKAYARGNYIKLLQSFRW